MGIFFYVFIFFYEKEEIKVAEPLKMTQMRSYGEISTIRNNNNKKNVRKLRYLFPKLWLFRRPKVLPHNTWIDTFKISLQAKFYTI